MQYDKIVKKLRKGEYSGGHQEVPYPKAVLKQVEVEESQFPMLEK